MAGHMAGEECCSACCVTEGWDFGFKSMGPQEPCMSPSPSTSFLGTVTDMVLSCSGSGIILPFEQTE